MMLVLKIAITLYIVISYLLVLPFIVSTTKQVYVQTRKLGQRVPFKVPFTAILLALFAPFSMPYILFSISKGIRKQKGSSKK